jgi:CHAD domain-containing protein
MGRAADQAIKLTAAGLAVAAIGAQVTALQQLDAALRGAPSARDVHGARVAVRRLRCHLRTFDRVFAPAWTAALAAELRWLGDGLAAARDADVLLADVSLRAAALAGTDGDRLRETIAPIRARHDAAYARLAALVAEPRYAALLASLATAVHRPELGELAGVAATSVTSALMRPVWRRVRQAVRAAGRTPDDAALHRIRIKAKYARYAAEAMIPVSGRRAKRFARRIETLQVRLGKQHDAVNAAGVLRELQASPEVVPLDGALVAEEVALAAKLRRRWRDCWRRVADDDVRFW